MQEVILGDNWYLRHQENLDRILYQPQYAQSAVLISIILADRTAHFDRSVYEFTDVWHGGLWIPVASTIFPEGVSFFLEISFCLLKCIIILFIKKGIVYIGTRTDSLYTCSSLKNFLRVFSRADAFNNSSLVTLTHWDEVYPSGSR